MTERNKTQSNSGKYVALGGSATVAIVIIAVSLFH